MKGSGELWEELHPLISWMQTEALPYWADIGFDHDMGGFHERLDLGARPITDVPRRLMVQGRQLFVYCSAQATGFFTGTKPIADRCVELLIRRYYRPDGRPGWVYSIEPDGRVANSVRDLYAHAFVLLGLGEYLRCYSDASVREVVNETLAYLDESFATIFGGYADAVPSDDGLRRQNPHMHLFEAMLSLYRATGDARFLARSGEVFGLFASRFFQPDGGFLCEYLTPRLDPLPDARGQLCEPGHHYEWIWLLRTFERLSGRATGIFCEALYTHANTYGWDKAGFIVDELDACGRPTRYSRRSWPHTEALKANLMEWEAGRAGCAEKAAHCARVLIQHYVGRLAPAAWIDHYDVDGRSLSAFIPASTLYHLWGAVLESLRITGQANELSRKASNRQQPVCRLAEDGNAH